MNERGRRSIAVVPVTQPPRPRVAHVALRAGTFVAELTEEEAEEVAQELLGAVAQLRAYARAGLSRTEVRRSPAGFRTVTKPMPLNAAFARRRFTR